MTGHTQRALRRCLLISLALTALVSLVLSGCRSRIGGPCEADDDCGLGLYCNLDKEVCADRGQLLKKQAEEIYVYPIPPKAGPKGAAPVPVPPVVPAQKTAPPTGINP